MGTAAAIVGGSVISGIFSNKAASKQAKVTDKAINAQNELLGPWSQAGMDALPALQAFVDNGANYADTQAYKDITNSAKAAGMGLSGNRLTALTDYYANNFRPNRMAELLAIPTLGQASASGQAANLGNLYQSKGATQAGGVLGVGNAINSGINSLAFLNAFKQNGVQSGVNSLLNQPGMF